MKDLTYLSSLNLNHLLVLVAVMRTGSVTEAARQLKRSQSAVSHALGRLRDDLEDPLFVRAGLQLVATPRAEEIAEGLEELLPSLSKALDPPGDFQPELSEATFRVASEDIIQHFFTAPLVGELERRASDAKLIVTPFPAPTELSDTLALDLEVALTTSPLESAGIHDKFLFSEPLSCVMRANHPSLEDPPSLDLKSYCLLRHVLVSPSGQTDGLIDARLEDHNMTRHVSLTLPNLLTVGDVVSASNLVATLPQRFAKNLLDKYDNLVLLDPPETISDISIHMVWHDRVHDSPAQLWLRHLITEIAEAEAQAHAHHDAD